MLTLLHNSLGTYTIENQRMVQHKVLGHCKNIDHLAYCLEVNQLVFVCLLFEFYFSSNHTLTSAPSCTEHEYRVRVKRVR